MSYADSTSKRPVLAAPNGAPRRFMICRYKDMPPWLQGFYFKIISSSYQDWAIFAPAVNDDGTSLAKLIALGIIDRTANAVTVGLMPARPACVVLRDDDTFRDSITRPLAPWILSEIDRLYPRLKEFSSQIAGEMKKIDSVVPAILRPLTADAPFRQGPELQFEFELPELAVDQPTYRVHCENQSRDSIVKREYMRNRFMAHLPRSSLDERALSVFRNTYQIDQRGRITLDANDPKSYYWQDRFSEILKEYMERSITMEELGRFLSSDEGFNRGLSGTFRRVSESLRTVIPPPAPYIVKYGSYEHIHNLLRNGRIRMGAARSFDDASLVASRRDEEMRRVVDWDSSMLPFLGIGNHPSYASNPEPSRLRTALSIEDNYLIFCVSEILRARLFNDFVADAALIIRDPSEFASRFRTTLRKRYPTWGFQAGPVEYFDPLNVSPCDVNIPFWKDFSYAYQEEFRFALFPPKDTTHLSELFIEIGSLEDIANLVILEKKPDKGSN